MRDVTLMGAHKTMKATISEGSSEIKHKILFVLDVQVTVHRDKFL